MKKILIAMLATSALVGAANAEMKDYSRSGYWTNSAGTGDDNSRLCSMSATDTQGRMVLVKYNATNANYFFHFVRPTWRIPHGTAVPLEIGFDKNAWSAPATQGTGNTVRSGRFTLGLVEIGLAPDWVSDFFENFREANAMWIRFGGNEQAWVFDMTGSRHAAKVFEACVAYMKVNAPTQPYQSQAPSQPYNGGPTQRPVTVPYSPNDRGA